ncbi:CHAT domain-containing protein [Streptomyces albidoflavus]|uniref:CHAT domain-containing protein n=1 Tax=Streptomyces albidoflavus TaxID=1886 RepID=UPI000A1C90A0|nr:CHAT domain-containing protein [Streptomyces albidoflavus]RZE84931.1 CHAT domain-containing protein [Streptomyces albidoflavus]
MTEETPGERGEEEAAGLRAWAAVAVRQAHELWPRVQEDPREATFPLVVEHLTTLERLLPQDDPARAPVVCWLGLLLKVRILGLLSAERSEYAAAVTHLRWADRCGPPSDRLAQRCRRALAELLVPPGIDRQVRDPSLTPEAAGLLRLQLGEAMEVLGRVVAGDLTTREEVLPFMERVATLLAALPGEPGEGAPRPPAEDGRAGARADRLPPVSGEDPAQRAMADAVRELVAEARRDGVWCARLLSWLCAGMNDPRGPETDAARTLADLGLDRPVFAPLRELLAALADGGHGSLPLVERLRQAARAVRQDLLALEPEAPERVRVAKFHAALLLAGNLRMPEAFDFAEVDGAAMRPDPDPAVRSVRRGAVSLDLILTTAIDNLWVSNGDLGRVERSVAWLTEAVEARRGEAAWAAEHRYLTTLLAQRTATAAHLGGSLQDSAAALSMAERLAAADDGDEVLNWFSLVTAYQLARRGQGQAAPAGVTDRLIRTLGERHASPAPEAAVRFVIAGTLGIALHERAARTHDRADLRAAVRYLREAVAIDAATVTPLFAPFLAPVRAELMTELARADPRRESVDGAAAEIHRLAAGGQLSPWHEARLRLGLGRAMLRATTHRSDLSLLDPCIEELSRARTLADGSPSRSLRADVLVTLSAAHWTSAVTGGSRATEDRETGLKLRREALELLAADVLLQLGAEHALSAARAATGHVLWLALRRAEGHRPADAVEALELGRALVLRTAAAEHGVPRLLADRGHAELAAHWRAQTPRHPLEPGPADPGRASAAPAPPVSVAGLPSSLRRAALTALGLGDGDGARDLLGTPDPAALGAALAASGADALVYLIPGEGFRPHIPGRALVLRPGRAEPEVLPLPLLLTPGSHQLERYLAAAGRRSARHPSAAAREAAEAEWRAALDALCDWAWPAAVGPVLDTLEPLGRPPRIVLIPCGPLGVVPWHAARTHIPLGGHRYACQDAVFSYAPSGGQFLRAAGRERLPLDEGQVLVTDPLLSLVWAEVETEALRSAYYPGARRFGEHVAADGVPDAPGSGADLLSVLPGGDRPAAVVHVSCHGVAGPSPTRSALSLADGELTVARILDEAAPGPAPGTAGPLVVLSACETDLSTGDHDEALTLSTALVARGAADVVGSRWAVDDCATALMMAVLHHFLAGEGLAPPDALRAAQLWMLDPERRPPPGMAERLCREAHRADLGELPLWAAFTHQGDPGAELASVPARERGVGLTESRSGQGPPP